MKINSAVFTKSIIDPEEMLKETLPQVAFIGRSNVGKSSLINTLTKQKNLAKTSSFPGHTRQINTFVINNKFLLVDLPGYGYARLSSGGRDKIYKLINGYLFDPKQTHAKVVLIIDAVVGPTDTDFETLAVLENHKKDFVIVVNKVDKLKNSIYQKTIKEIEEKIGYKIIPFSAKTKKGIGELLNEISLSIS